MLSQRISRICLGLLAFTMLVVVLLALFPIGFARQIPGFLLLWILPAITWSRVMAGARGERLLLGAAIALAINSVLTLIITLLPGEFPWYLGLIGVVLVILIPILLPKQEHDLRQKRIRLDKVLIAFIMIGTFALLLRLPNMGYKEIQGDEGIILARAAESITGDDNVLFLHQKGPMEILIPIISWSLTGAINEYWLRLPFTWAGILSVLAVYAVAKRWFDTDVGIVSSLLFAIGGFGIAFSRIIQYQSLVLLWATLAVFCASRYRDSGRQGDLILSIFFAATSILAHYDALLFIPAVLWLLFARLRSNGFVNWRSWLIAAALGASVMALFYLPFILNSNFQRTLNYLIGDRVGMGGNGQLGVGLSRTWQMATFYNSTWYILGVGILAAIGLVVTISFGRQLAAVLLFVVPFLFYTLIVTDPRTHIYTAFVGATILAGVGAVQVWTVIHKGGNKGLSYAGFALFVGWFLVSAIYPVLLFVDVGKERQRTWAENRPAPWLYRTTWQDPPEYGLFGFPHQAGWRAAPKLLESAGSYPYASNEEEEITNWYMSQAARTHCPDFETLLIADNAQDAVPVASEWFDDLQLQGQITVQGESRIEIYRRSISGEIDIVSADNASQWKEPQDMIPALPADLVPVNQVFDGLIRLIGYEIKNEELNPGGKLTVILYWQALGPISQNKQVFVHLYDERMISQHDGAPECGVMPTTRWEEGQIIIDPHVLTLPKDTPAGNIPLYTGLYDLISGDRMKIEGRNEDSILLTKVATS